MLIYSTRTRKIVGTPTADADHGDTCKGTAPVGLMIVQISPTTSLRQLLQTIFRQAVFLALNILAPFKESCENGVWSGLELGTVRSLVL
jgi:hypothetical protein